MITATSPYSTKPNEAQQMDMTPMTVGQRTPTGGMSAGGDSNLAMSSGMIRIILTARG